MWSLSPSQKRQYEKDLFHILTHLRHNEIHMSIASYNTRASHYLESMNVRHFFDHVIGSQNVMDKYVMITEILNRYKEDGIILEPSHLLFFDDDIVNIERVRGQKITSVCVGKKTGVTMKLIEGYITFSKVNRPVQKTLEICVRNRQPS